jgi:Protein of unknown function (DUF3108)
VPTVGHVVRCTLLASAALALTAAALPASAEGKLEARYIATLAGIPIGEGNWIIDIGENRYSAAASGNTTGLLQAFTGGHGTSAAQGTLNGNKKLSSVYGATIFSRKKIDEIRLSIANGNVKDNKVDPPQEDNPERVPVTEAHQRGVLDPMTATMLHVPGTGDPMAPESCQRTLSVFDGRIRYDLKLAYKRMDKVKAIKGYSGPVLVCAVYFTPVSGYVPSRTAIKYLAEQRDIEVWLAPIAGTRVLVPFRAQGPTPIGQAVLQATQFISAATPAKAAANGAKTQ